MAAMAATPRGPPQPAWHTPREGGSDVGTLKMAGLGSLGLSARRDPAPGVRPSGKAGEVGDLAALSKSGLQPDIIMATPRTPENLSDVRKRHRHRSGAGEITTHWGLRESKIPDPQEGYGVKSNKDDDVARNFAAGQKFGVAEYLSARGEATYYSSRREPLGKGYERGHAIPEKTKVDSFIGFGKPISKGKSAKDAICPRGIEPDTKAAKDLYRRTHGSTDPGEMTQRDYAWPTQIASNPYFRFGATENHASMSQSNGVKNAMTMVAVDDPLAVPGTQVVKSTLEHYRVCSKDHLGKSRNLLQGLHHLPQNFTFGMKSTADDHSAGQLIRGTYSDMEQLPDADLGCCNIVGRRNKPPTERRVDITKPFGVPSIRHDVVAPAPDKRSLANATNFGDDYDACGLIFPGKFLSQGLSDDDFRGQKSKEELQSILEGAGYKLPVSDFEEVFGTAAAMDGQSESQTASIEAIMRAYSEWVTNSITKQLLA